MMQIPTTVEELAKAMTPTWILITLGILIFMVARHILILTVAFKNRKEKRLGVQYLITFVTDLLTLAIIALMWVFRELVIKISFI